MNKENIYSIGISSFAWQGMTYRSIQEKLLLLKESIEWTLSCPTFHQISVLKWHNIQDLDNLNDLLLTLSISWGAECPEVLVYCSQTKSGGLTLSCTSPKETDARLFLHTESFLRAALSVLEHSLFSFKNYEQTPEISRIAEKNTTGRTLPSLLLHYAFDSEHRDTVAIKEGTKEVTFGDLAHIITRFTSTIEAEIRRNLNSVEAIVIEGTNSYKLIAACCAANILGFPFVCIDPTWPASRKELVLDQLPNAARIYPDEEAIEEVGEVPARLPDIVARPWDVAYIIFTSGSTGVPKGVVVTHDSAINTIDAVNEQLSLNSSDVGISMAPPGFDLWIFDVFGLLGIGGTLVLPTQEERMSPTAWCWLCISHGVTFWNSVPATFDVMLDQARGVMPSIRNVMWSGDWIPLSLPGRAREKMPKATLWSFGGATEGSIWSICFKIPSQIPAEWPSIPYGKALANQTITVNDENGAEVREPNVRGEIYIGGRGVVEGYLNDPEKTADKFVFLKGNRFYRTGDLGEIMDDGNIRIIGRIDNQVKIHGYRVELGDIQSVLERLPNIISAVVIAPWDDEKHTERRIVACIIAAEEIDYENIRKELNKHLPRYMMPSTIIPFDSFPLTSNGKVDRRALEEKYYLVQDLQSDNAGHLFDFDNRTAEQDRDPGMILFEHCKKLWTVSIDYEKNIDFYHIEGDSLRAVRLLGSLQQDQRVSSIDETLFLELIFAGDHFSNIGNSEAIKWSI